MACVLALLALGAGCVWGARRIYVLPGPSPRPIVAVVPRGSPQQVAAALRDAGIIDRPRAFLAAVELTRGDRALHAGEFAFPAAASLEQVLTVLRTARPVQHRVTIPEGLTAARIALLLTRVDALAGEAVLPREGEVMPQTYDFERGASAESIVARGRLAMRRALEQAWAGRAPHLPLRDPAELLVLASIVERETARPDERPHIAAVFLNRLRLGMRLQADPTVIYAVSGGDGVFPRALTRADLEWPNPYNTYTSPGLPPGPIGSPGLAAIEAVAHPAVSDDLYFVADGGGGHMFARTLEQHQRNVARWRLHQEGG
jgi:UPF0755 protein